MREVSAARRTAGAGSELHQLRDYVPGDALARIDWKATARTRNLVSREFSEDQHLDVLVVLDAGRFSRARAGHLDRFGLYANIAARFAEVVTPNDDRIGLLVFSDRPLAVCAAGSGTCQPWSECAGLSRASLGTSRSPMSSAAAVRRVAVLKHRGLIVLLTGLDDPTDALNARGAAACTAPSRGRCGCSRTPRSRAREAGGAQLARPLGIAGSEGARGARRSRASRCDVSASPVSSHTEKLLESRHCQCGALADAHLLKATAQHAI